MSTPRLHLALPLACLILFGTVHDLRAQIREPVGPFVVDARVALPRFKEDVGVASAIGVDSVALPTRGLGLVLGAHWYPVRSARIALGVGGEVLLSSASRTPEAEDPAEGAPPTAAAPTVETRFSAVSPQISLNFGSGRGWSYLTGGFGWAGFTTERDDAPVADPESRPRVLNYGGGARWFAREHVAFAVDLRFYALGAQEATTGRPAYPGKTLMVFSAGVAFK